MPYNASSCESKQMAGPHGCHQLLINCTDFNNLRPLEPVTEQTARPPRFECGLSKGRITSLFKISAPATFSLKCFTCNCHTITINSTRHFKQLINDRANSTSIMYILNMIIGSWSNLSKMRYTVAISLIRSIE